MQKILIVLVMAAVAFWYFGGFKLIRFFKNRKLKAGLTNPFDQKDFVSTKNNYAAGSSLPDKISFTEYAIAKKIDVNDHWTKVAFDTNPDNPVAAFFYAHFLMAEMLALRGTSTADKLSDSQVNAIRQKLEDAERVAKIFETFSDYPAEASTLLIDIYIHSGRSEEIASLAHNKQSAFDGRIDLVERYLRSRYPRWGGSHESLQQKAEQFSARGGALLAAKAIAYCHLMEDQSLEAYKQLIKNNPIDVWVKAYEQLPKAPNQIRSIEDFNLLLSHKLFAKFFFYTNDDKRLKKSILNCSWNFSGDEYINPHSKKPSSFYDMAIELKLL